MALNNFKCKYLTPPHFKGLKQLQSSFLLARETAMQTKQSIVLVMDIGVSVSVLSVCLSTIQQKTLKSYWSEKKTLKHQKPNLGF